jgi:hypothetical protein
MQMHVKSKLLLFFYLILNRKYFLMVLGHYRRNASKGVTAKSAIKSVTAKSANMGITAKSAKMGVTAKSAIIN